MKIINVNPVNNYKLHIQLDNFNIYEFDVLAEIESIPSYKCLMNYELFKQVYFKSQRIYWNMDCDFHIDQILDVAKKIS